MNTLELFNEIAWFAACHDLPRTTKPGEYYNRLSENTKEQLKNLKSDDLNRLRLDEVLPMIRPPDTKVLSDMLLEFDAKVAKARSGLRYQNLE